MIKNVKILKNVVIADDNHEQAYTNKKGIIVIEEDKGKKYILDLDSECDISESDYLHIVNTSRTKESVLFDNLALKLKDKMNK